MPLESIGLPRVAMITHPLYGTIFALECLCGEPIPYPGFSGATNPIACKHCDQHYHAVPPATLQEQTYVERDPD